jgi:hypothetical protein
MLVRSSQDFDETPEIATTENSATFWRLHDSNMSNPDIAELLEFDEMHRTINGKPSPYFYRTSCFVGQRLSRSEITISPMFDSLRKLLETFADEILWKQAESAVDEKASIVDTI